MKQLTARWLETEAALPDRIASYSVDGREVTRDEFLAVLEELGTREAEN